MNKKSYEVGSGNGFEDIGIPNAEEHLVKAQLVFEIDAIMKTRRMKQTQAAALFEVRQRDISRTLRGEFRPFSVERLLRFLVKLDQDVEIVVRSHQGKGDAPALHVSQLTRINSRSFRFAKDDKFMLRISDSGMNANARVDKSPDGRELQDRRRLCGCRTLFACGAAARV